MDSTLALYLKEIGRIPVMSREEEHRCAEQAAAGDERAREALARANLRFVVQVAKRHRHLGLPLEDLINEGNVGLLRAIEHYEADRGCRFITYAAWWIRQSMLRACRGRPGAPREPAVSLDAPRGGSEDSLPLGDLVADTASEGPDAAAIASSLAEDVDAVLGQLPGMEANVLRGRFGLRAGRGASLAELGRRYSLTKERIRQIEIAALRRIRRSPATERLTAYAG